MDIKPEREPEAQRWVAGRIEKFAMYPPGWITDSRIAVRSFGKPERYLEFYLEQMVACVIDYHGYTFGTGLFEESPRRELIRKVKIKKVDGILITLEHPITL